MVNDIELTTILIHDWYSPYQNNTLDTNTVTQ